jgi:hypothetical protein
MPQGCPNPFIRRLTKCILHSLHPEYDYFGDFFTVDFRLPTPDSVAAVEELIAGLPQLARGNGVFRLWRGFNADRDAGACVYLFFDAVCFVCLFGKATEFKQSFEDGYSEEPGLPAFL